MDDPTEEHHCLILNDSGVKIFLQLIGIMTYFQTRQPQEDEYLEALTLGNVDEEEWDPHDVPYAREEECMSDFSGYVIEKKSRKRQIFDEIDKTTPTHGEINGSQIDDLFLTVSAMSMNDGEAQ